MGKIVGLPPREEVSHSYGLSGKGKRGAIRGLGPAEREPAFEETYELRDWELKFATSKPYWEDRMEEDDSDPWGGWGDEQEGVHPYDLTRSVAEVLPLTRYIFPSGRDAFMNKDWAGRSSELAWELAGIIPAFLLGKGLKMTTGVMGKALTLPFKGAGKVVKKLPFSTKKVIFEQAPFLDECMGQIPKYERVPAWEKAMKKYGISPEEGRQLIEERPSETVMRIWGMGEGKGKVNLPVFGSKEFRELFTKEGKVTEKIAKQLRKWKESHETQELKHYIGEWEKTVRKLFDYEYKPKDLWELQMVRLYGEGARKLGYGDVDMATVGNALRDILKTKPAKYLQDIDIAYGHFLPYHLLPIRKVLGLGEKAWQSYSKIYLPTKRIFANANSYSYVETANFQVVMASRGLGKLSRKVTGEYKWKPTYSGFEWDEAGVAITSLDTMAAKGASSLEMQGLVDALSSEKVRKITLSWLDYKDHLYKDYMKKKIWQVFEKIGLTEGGKDALVGMMKGPKGFEKVLDATFSVGNNLEYKAKAKIVSALLGKAREKVLIPKQGVNWFSDLTRKELADPMQKKVLTELKERLVEGMKELTPMEKGKRTKGFVQYLENYAMIIKTKGVIKAGERTKHLTGKRTAGFRKSRGEDIGERSTELNRIIDGRIRMQAKELYVYPHLDAVVKRAVKMPLKYKRYSDHYISRMLGEPSQADFSQAQFLSRFMGGRKMSNRDTMNLAWRVNDLNYMGGIGLKPFSVLRNYFQPLLLVPADMGGVKDYYWLGKGLLKALTSKAHRQYIRNIGAIGEYAPELYMNPAVSNFGKRLKILGGQYTLPSLKAFREFTMYMFKHSDMHNRYVTGCAAITKWDKMAERVLRSGDSWDLSAKAVNRFMKKINVNSRESAVRAQIAGHLRSHTRSGLEEAKKIWTNDVIADTQYLYGRADAPIFTHTMGAFGRTAGIFQTWWMNYGSLLEKWFFRTPDSLPLVNQRTLNWIASGMMAEQLAQTIWTKEQAGKMMWMGPFPTKVNEFMIPPAYSPVYYGLQSMITGASALAGRGTPEAFKRQIKALGKSSVMFVPGGLQWMSMYKGYKTDEDWSLAKSIIRYNPEED